MSAPTRSRRRRTAPAVAAAFAVGSLAACAPAPEWNKDDLEAVAALEADPWLAPSSLLAPGRAGESDHVGQYHRPGVVSYRELTGDPDDVGIDQVYRDTVARELEQLASAAWTPTFVRCSAEEVTVDVVKVVGEDLATGRVSITFEARGAARRTAVLPDRRDGADQLTPATTFEPVDLSICAERVESPLWSGTPTQRNILGTPTAD